MKFSFIIIIKILLLIYGQDNNNLEFKGIYKINSLYNNYSLTDENYCLQFFNNKYKNHQIYRIIKNENGTFYFEIKKNKKKIGVNINGHVLSIYNTRDKKDYRNTTEWNIIPIDDNQYVIQNTYNKKFMEINNNFVQCINDLPLPIKEHKTEITKNFIFTFYKVIEEVEITAEQEKVINEEPIDVVIKYIDLTDKNLNRTGIKQIKKDEDNEELRYSVRSILENIPWVRKIFILMPNEKVKYFKTYDRIKQKIIYVKDKDVLGFDCANIYAFTFNLFRLEKFGLSNNFIYMDDDFFIGKELNKSNFFYYEPKEKRVVPSLSNMDFTVLHKERVLEKYNDLFSIKESLATQSFKAWALSLYSSEKFFLDNYNNITLINPTPSHNAIAYNIQDLKEIYELVINNYKYANEFLNSIERHILTLQTQHFVDLYELNIKKRKVNSIKFNVFPMNLIKLDYLNIELFAINTGGDANYTEEEYRKQREIMQIRFPNQTPYEIEDLTLQNKSRPYDPKQINGNKQIYQINNNENPSGNIDDEEKNYINALKHEYLELSEKEFISLVKNNKKKTFIIKIYNWFIILMIIFIFILLLLLLIEKNKNKNIYIKLNDSDNRKKIEIED